jgi:hypothetical protein
MVRALRHVTKLAMRLLGSLKKSGGPSRAVAPLVPFLGTHAILKFDGNLDRVRNLYGINNGHMTC